MPKGSKPGERRGGRQKGTPNKSTSIREAEIAATGLIPRDYFLDILRGPPPADATPDQLAAYEAKRFAAAKELMPYCHARLASTEANTQVTIAEDWVDKLE